MPFIVNHSAVGLQGRTANRGDIIEHSDLAGCDIERMVEAGAISHVADEPVSIASTTFERVADATEASRGQVEADLKAKDAEIVILKSKLAEANEIIEALTDDELAEAKKRADEKKAAAPTQEKLEAMTKAQLLDLCNAKGIEANERTKKEDIIGLLLK